MKYWNKIANIGVKPGFSNADLRRIQLINKINFFCTGFSFCFIPCAFLFGMKNYVPYQFITGALCLFSFFLSYKGLFTASSLWLIFVLTTNLFYCNTSYHGTGVEHFFFPIAIMPFATIKKKSITYVIVCWCVFGYFLTKYFVGVLPPMGKIEEPQLTIIFSLVLLAAFASVIIIIANLKTANDRFEENLLQQKNLMEEQKMMVEEKQKEILDSIYYARRIQRALITSEMYIKRNLEKLKKDSSEK
ncbi:MAG: hypothetical protein IAF38_07215 [Bacteroidia bacterium]|nr:hypothetical protein [Bacteroidia bacterium]